MILQKFSEFNESVKTPCQTPNVKYNTIIKNDKINIEIILPTNLDLNESEAKLLEDNIHNSMELVLARYFIK